MKKEDLVEILQDALQYVEGAYECAFPDQDENDSVASRIKEAIEDFANVIPVSFELDDNELEPLETEWRSCLMLMGYRIGRINDMCHGFSKGIEWFIQELIKRRDAQKK